MIIFQKIENIKALIREGSLPQACLETRDIITKYDRVPIKEASLTHIESQLNGTLSLFNKDVVNFDEYNRVISKSRSEIIDLVDKVEKHFLNLKVEFEKHYENANYEVTQEFLKLLAPKIVKESEPINSLPKKNISGHNVLGSVSILFTLLSLIVIFRINASIEKLKRDIVVDTDKDFADYDYITNYTYYRVDLRGFNAVDSVLKKTGPDLSFVYVDRKDFVEKITEKNIDFRFDSYTSGKEVKMDFISYPQNLYPKFYTIVGKIKNPNRIDYEYVVPMGEMDKGRKEVLVNRYTYINGFSDDRHEWWGASTKYPTKAIAVTLVFPKGKPCKDINVYRQLGNSMEKIPIKDNYPAFTDNREVAYWMGLNEKSDTKIWFEWTW